MTILISDSVPKLNVEAMCKAAAADDKAMGLALPESYNKCMQDETTAQQKLTAIWQAHSAPLRDRCEVGAKIGQSYVDLLTCLQAADIANPPLQTEGASKNRSAK